MLVDGDTRGDRDEDADASDDAEIEGDKVPSGVAVLERDAKVDEVPVLVTSAGDAVVRPRADAFGDSVFVALEQIVGEL